MNKKYEVAVNLQQDFTTTEQAQARNNIGAASTADLEAAQDSWQSGFTPKGEATVSQIDALTTQSNGDQYIVTDSGTITAGSVAVVAGDMVAWNATDEVWYKVTQYAKASDVTALNDALSKALGDKKTFAAVQGTEYRYNYSCDLKSDQSFVIKVSASNGIFTNNKVNVRLYHNSNVVSTTSIDLNKVYAFTCTTDTEIIQVIRTNTGVSGSGDVVIDFGLFTTTVTEYLYNHGVAAVESLQTEYDNFIDGDISFSSNVDLSGASTGYLYNSDGELVANSYSKYKEVTLDSSFDGELITIQVDSATLTGGTRYFVLEDGDGNKLYAVSDGQVATAGYVVTIPVTVHTGYTLKCSWSTALSVPSVGLAMVTKSIQDRLDFSASPAMYVSPNGNDSADGLSELSPKKTINACLSAGASVVHIASGNYDDALINLTLSKSDKVVLKGDVGAKIVFRKSSALIANDGLESLVTGYTKVYSVTADAPSYSDGAKWLFFDSLDDVTTAISASDAQPQERGKFYRCDCTKLVHTTATVLSDALAEIDACEENEYKWFAADGKIYFNRAASTATYPLYKSVGNYFSVRKNQSVEIENIEFRYGVVNLLNINNGKVKNCAAKYVYGGGAFMYGNNLSLVFDTCEAACAFTSTYGDGFNGHVSGTAPGTKRLQVELKNCWSHDNLDDGWSDHDFGETLIIGGLYEYNGKAGITPSYGTHCTCIDVYSRNNYSGFHYYGTATDGGNGGQLTCYNCVAESNSHGTATQVGGFIVTGSGNALVLVGCKSIANKNAYYANEGCYITLIDCSASDTVSNVKDGAGTFAIKNGTIVS